MISVIRVYLMLANSFNESGPGVSRVVLHPDGDLNLTFPAQTTAF